MKILVLGASGMLGHKLTQRLAANHSVSAAVRDPSTLPADHPAFAHAAVHACPDARADTDIARVIDAAAPDVVINAVGMVKQRDEAAVPETAVAINALIPHRLARLAEAAGARLIHVSTDCVFKGDRGGYTEDDTPDAEDLYGRSKLLGEVDRAPHLTIRTSIVGRELRGHLGLFEWFISQAAPTGPGKTRGFTKAIYSGLTTAALADLIERVLADPEPISGLWHASSDPIDKHTLLSILSDRMSLGIDIEPFDGFRIDRSMGSKRLRERLGWTPPSWDAMISELAADPTPYPSDRPAAADHQRTTSS